MAAEAPVLFLDAAFMHVACTELVQTSALTISEEGAKDRMVFAVSTIPN